MLASVLLGGVGGLLTGIFTGLVPGIHMNLIATFLSINTFLVMGRPQVFIPFLMTLSISHNFFEYIPTIFLSVPEDSTALLTRPSLKLVKKGKGLAALKTILLGSLSSVLVFLLLIPVLMVILPASYKVVKGFTWVFLVALSIHLILREKELNKIIWASVVFSISAVLGYITLESYTAFKLMPLLTGLFGTPFLIKSLERKGEVPKQNKDVNIEVDKKQLLFGNFLGIFATFMLGLFPGIGPAQASLVANEVKDDSGPKDFLVTMGSINTNDIMFSVLALYTIKKPRAGTIAVIKDLFNFSSFYFMIFIPIAIVTAIVCYLLAIRTGKIFANRLKTLNRPKVVLAILCFLIGVVFLLEQFYGVLILLAGTLIGYLALEKEVKSSHAMGALIVPTILYFI